jgi:hypothetical protein
MANEASKIRDLVLHIVDKDWGLDLGCGSSVISSAAVGVDPGGYAGVARSTAYDYLKTMADNSVPWIFSSHHLEHEPDPGMIISECFRAMAHGGKLILYVPDMDVYKNSRGKDPNSEHWNRFSVESLVGLVGHHGFDIEFAVKRNTVPQGHCFTGNGGTEHPGCATWEYSILLIANRL